MKLRIRDLHSVIFYTQNYGIFNRGQFVRGVVSLQDKLFELYAQGAIDISEILYDNESFTSILEVYTKNPEGKFLFECSEKYLDRIFICNDDNAIKLASNLFERLSYNVSVVEAHERKAVSTYRDVDIVLLKAELFEQIELYPNFIPDIQCSILKDSNLKTHIVNYDYSSKPISHKLYDACFYAEKWSLLTFYEKALRIIFTGVAFCIPPLSLIIIVAYHGHKKDLTRSNYFNLRPWQYREYISKVPQSSYDVMFNCCDDIKDVFRNKVVRYSKDAHYFNEESVCMGATINENCTTPIGKAVSDKDVFLLIAKDQELTKAQLALRYYLLFVIAIVGCSRIMQLILGCYFNKGITSLYGSFTSYVVLLLGFISLFCVRNVKIRVISTICTAITSMMAAVTLISIINNTSNMFLFTYEKWISVALLSMATIMTCILFGISNCYAKDRMVASELHLSTTAYLTIKKQLDNLVKEGYVTQYNKAFDKIQEPFLKEACMAGVFGSEFMLQEESGVQEEGNEAVRDQEYNDESDNTYLLSNDDISNEMSSCMLMPSCSGLRSKTTM